MVVPSPLPYFGKKDRVAARAWSAFGANVQLFVDSFCGSASMLLARPSVVGYETINDLDGYVTNFWRAVAFAEPAALARAIHWPISELDLDARHRWLVARGEKLVAHLTDDPEYFDLRAAAWWAWGLGCWIGDGFCDGKTGDKMPNIDGFGDKGVVGKSLDELVRWFTLLHLRLANVRIVCGDWKRTLTKTALRSRGVRAVFLDPPYRDGNQQYAAGGTRTTLSKAARVWCQEHQDDDDLRIIIAGRGDEHRALEASGWWAETWSAKGGYGQETKAARHTECLWFSPQCERGAQLSLGVG